MREAGVENPGLLRGFATAAREAYVGPGPWKLIRASAMERGYSETPDDDPTPLYDRVLIALDAERGLNNGEPVSLARWLGALELAPGERFLHVGCGVGYYTAIAAEALQPGGRALGLEVDPELAARAARNTASNPSLDVRHADGPEASDGLFDAIFVNAGATEVQPRWLDALADGGRLFVPLTVSLPDRTVGAGWMLLVERDGAAYAARFHSPVGIFHCEGARSADAEARLRAGFEGGQMPQVARLLREPHPPGPDCWLHGPDFCVARAAEPGAA